MRTAHACGAEIRIETFFRIRVNDTASVDCDTEGGVRQYAAHFFTPAPPSRVATNEEARASGERMVAKHRETLEKLAEHDTVQEPPPAADAVDPQAASQQRPSTR